ncbi:MAG TPA: tRNA (adenosine(37)-N6)-threonylcarbamoyltransferase complex ATPase subunit type 1 TsaE [Thermoanaerobaculia bacterium]
MNEILSRSETETEDAGRRLAAELSPDDVVYLRGDLGAGKTAFVRGLAAGLCARDREVASPTFAIVHEYADAREVVVLRHLDLYRLEDDTRELEALGLPEALSGAPLAVEWPGKAVRALLPPTIEVQIARRGDGEREITVQRAKR